MARSRPMILASAMLAVTGGSMAAGETDPGLRVRLADRLHRPSMPDRRNMLMARIRSSAAFAGAGLRRHMVINRSPGDPNYPATAVVDAWLAKVLAG